MNEPLVPRATAMREWAMFNAILVGIDFFVIAWGIHLARVQHRYVLHRKVMIAAGLIFVAFLVSFLLKVLTQGVQDFPTWEIAFGINARHILFVHEAVALITVPLIGAAYWFALVKKDFIRHKKVVRWAAPLWLFESAFGIVEFLILYAPT